MNQTRLLADLILVGCLAKTHPTRLGLLDSKNPTTRKYSWELLQDFEPFSSETAPMA